MLIKGGAGSPVQCLYTPLEQSLTIDLYKPHVHMAMNNFTENLFIAILKTSGFELCTLVLNF